MPLNTIICLTILALFMGEHAMAFTLTSPAFKEGETIPVRYTCDGQDMTPELNWQDAPMATKSLVLIMDDPDAPMGTWDHWILFNMPAATKGLPEALRVLPAGTKEGKNSWQKLGYGGPCPPDREHRYYFKLYALDSELSLSQGASKSAVEKAMQGHVLGQAELMGKYDRHIKSK